MTLISAILAFAVDAFHREISQSRLEPVLLGLGAMGRAVLMQCAAGVAIVMGLVALVVPGFVVAAATVVAIPVVAIEISGFGRTMHDGPHVQ